MRIVSFVALVLVCLSSLVAAPALADGPSKGKLRRAVRSALRESRAQDQALALEAALSGIDHEFAAELLVDEVFEEEDVRPQAVVQAALVLLGRMQDDQALAVLRRNAAEGELAVRALVLESLGRQRRPAARDVLAVALDDEHPGVRAAAATALGRTRDDDVAELLMDRLDDEDLRVRSAVVGALRELRFEAAVPALIERATVERGRLIDDVFSALQTITGERYGLHLDEYRTWWARRNEADVPDPSGYTAPAASFDHDQLRTRSRRILFVLPVGRSMGDELQDYRPDPELRAAFADVDPELVEELDEVETRLDLARVHLRRMLRTLADDVEFDVLIVGSSATRAFGSLERADARTRERAEGRIASLSPSGHADLADAVAEIFAPDGDDPWGRTDGPDTVVLLSDGVAGEPGKVDPLEIGPRAARWNAVRQVRFLVAAVGQADPSVLAALASGPPRGVFVQLR